MLNICDCQKPSQPLQVVLFIIVCICDLKLLFFEMVMNAVDRWNFMAQALLHLNVEEDMETGTGKDKASHEDLSMAGRAEHTSSVQTN